LKFSTKNVAYKISCNDCNASLLDKLDNNLKHKFLNIRSNQ